MPAVKKNDVAKSSAGRKAAKVRSRKPRQRDAATAQRFKPRKTSAQTARAVPARKSSGIRSTTASTGTAETYRHDEKAVQRPEVGVQHSFFAKKPPKVYRYDSSLDPALAWDENGSREMAEWLIGLIERAATEGRGRGRIA